MKLGKTVSTYFFLILKIRRVTLGNIFLSVGDSSVYLEQT